MSLKQLCACGHDIATHYLDPVSGKRLSCLGLHCKCRYYGPERQRDTPVLPMINFPEKFRKTHRPHADTSCQCKACREWEFQRFLFQW